MEHFSLFARTWSRLFALALPFGLASAATGAQPDRFAADVKPILEKFCISCHSGDEPEGQRAFDRYADGAAAGKDVVVWLKVADKLRAGEMPPKDEPRPSGEELARVTAWIDAVAKAECDGPRDPGRVTLRRLNRNEYDNTIRDLVGVTFLPGADFSSDDVGYGFDNIGDVLSMPPLLMEKYLAAAQQVAEAAVLLEPPRQLLLDSPAGRLELSEGVDRERRRAARINSSSAEVSATLSVPAAGRYRFRVRAWAPQAGDELAKMVLRVDGNDVYTVDIDAKEGASKWYETEIDLREGSRRVSVGFLNDYVNNDEPDPNKREDRDLIVESVQINALSGDYPAVHRRIIPRDPTPESKDALSREIVESFATRAFRRPATPQEVERLARLVALAEGEGDSFAAGIRLAVQAVLVSPHFLFRIEPDMPGAEPGAIRTLNDYEVATRLSYFLWSSMPDAELFEHARQGTLRKDNNLRQQVLRMIKDDKSQAMVSHFAGQWLQLRNLKTVAPHRRMFRGFNEQLREDMRIETEMFFAAVMREDRSVLDFLDGRYTFINERLARHYDISDVQGQEFRRVDLPNDRRGGVLTHASVLTVTSNPTRTSPVKRGKWVLENILGTPPPPPPPDVPELVEQRESELTGSLRQRMEQHRAKAECAVCHERMDPLGFGLENFNAIGAWRSREGQFDIDASGTLPGGATFAGPAELRTILLGKKDQFVTCLAEKMLTYALGRGLEYYDRCTVQDIVKAVTESDYRFSSMIMAVVQSDAFQKRRGKGDKP